MVLKKRQSFLALPEVERKRIFDAVKIGLHGTDMKGKSKAQKGKKAAC
jgi:hypothetical protein